MATTRATHLPSPSTAAFVACAAVALLCFAIDRRPAFWDFDTYRAGALALGQGLDPYQVADLRRASGLPIAQQNTYLPLIVWASAPLTWLPRNPALCIYLLLELAALGLLFQRWHRLLPAITGAWLPPFCLIAFSGALLVGLRSGNLEILVLAALWAAFAAWIRGRIALFCGLLFACGAVKLTPWFFVLLLPWIDHPARGRWLAGTLAAITAFLALNAMLTPALFHAWLAVHTAAGERGSLNPCSLALLETVARAAARHGLALPRAAVIISWLTLALCVTLLSRQRLARRPGPPPRGAPALTELLLFACVTFALIAPRFKNYSYALLVPVALAVLHTIPRRPLRLLALAALALPSAALLEQVGDPLRAVLAYWPLCCAAGLWWACYRRLRRDLPLASERVTFSAAVPTMPRDRMRAPGGDS